MNSNSKEAPDTIERFYKLVNLWTDLEDDAKRQLVNYWCVALTLEDLKAAGLVEGECDLDLPVAMMMFGFAAAKGVHPSTDPDVIAQMMTTGESHEEE